ncbi:Hsp20/alpha crystallin family protein [Luteitalea sp.]|jgi:HSP20 family molecular chaperone IbpA|uniref:Hsp20/alpha crystallin family protein n=1 Tax=Luteitalea sp. TaxID=2004800 RepID=UPI0037C506D2
MVTTTIARPTSKATSAIPTRTPYSLMRALSDDIESFFTEAGMGVSRWPIGARLLEKAHAGWLPAVEVEEKDGKLFFRADLPGMTREGITIEVGEHVLTITGERRESTREATGEYFRTERSYGHFSRTLALPETVKADSAVATFTAGVLEVVFEIATPKAPTTRQLPITEGVPTAK